MSTPEVRPCAARAVRRPVPAPGPPAVLPCPPASLGRRGGAGTWARVAVLPARAVRPGPVALAGGLLVASIGDPPSAGALRWAAAWTAAAGVRRVHLLHVREVPDTLPLGAWPLDARALARLRAWVVAVQSRGLRAELEVADTRRGERTVVERALAMRPQAVLLGPVRTGRGGLDRRAPYVLRHLRAIEVVLCSE